MSKAGRKNYLSERTATFESIPHTGQVHSTNEFTPTLELSFSAYYKIVLVSPIGKFLTKSSKVISSRSLPSTL